MCRQNQRKCFLFLLNTYSLKMTWMKNTGRHFREKRHKYTEKNEKRTNCQILSVRIPLYKKKPKISKKKHFYCRKKKVDYDLNGNKTRWYFQRKISWSFQLNHSQFIFPGNFTSSGFRYNELNEKNCFWIVFVK